jgi:hypothetical protein
LEAGAGDVKRAVVGSFARAGEVAGLDPIGIDDTKATVAIESEGKPRAAALGGGVVCEFTRSVAGEGIE